MNSKFYFLFSRFSFFCLLLSTFYFLASSVAFAQKEGGLTLTITPPLIKINMAPGEFWSSSVKMVNLNPEPLTVYASIMDFKSGEEGGVEFIQKEDISGGESFLLSQWLEVNEGPFEIPAFQSQEVPFNIRVPEDAEPGGHYAAILVGTRPMGKIEGSGIQVSSQMASLIMLNVQGETTEEGRIREFSTENSFYQKPEINFTVRLENTGNVHIQPQGEIKIYNFLGKERGTIPINYKTDFGNVLPQSVRKWIFGWKGGEGFFETGRYKAVLTLVFGKEVRQTVSRTLYFWVVPLKPTLGILGGLGLFLAFVVLAIRAYIRRAVATVQKETGISALARPIFKPKVLVGPVAGAVIDLRAAVFKKKEERVRPSKFSLFKIIAVSSLEFLIVALVFFRISFGINPVDIGQYLVAQVGSTIGVAVSVAPNPVSQLVQQLREKEATLGEKEKALEQKEDSFLKEKKVIPFLILGVVILLILISFNFYLDYKRKKVRTMDK